MLEIADHLSDDDPNRDILIDAVQRSMASMVNSYFTDGNSDEEGFLRHGSYFVRGGIAPDDFVIWGDYFFLEALMRLNNGRPGYWYETKGQAGE